MAIVWSAALFASVALGWQSVADATSGGQSVADVLREVSDADGAFVASGMLKPTFAKDDLSTIAMYPDDEVVVVAVKGSDLRQAFERSVSLYPQSNTSFLQVSGFEITFDPNLAPGQRIKNVAANGSRLDDSKEYRIAMPSSLGRGGYGYFRLWDRNKIVRTLESTIFKALVGKKMAESRSRWVVQS